MTVQERSAPHELRESAKQGETKSKKQLGAYRMPHDDIPPHFKELAQRKLQADEVIVHPAREGGAYKGKILHADTNFLVQAVGKEGRSAVVHRVSDLELVSQNLRWRAENDRLGSQNVQIHYNAGKGKVYPFDPDRVPAAQEKREAPSVAAASKDATKRVTLDPER